MTDDLKVLVLKGALAGAMKNHVQYQLTDHWKTILRGERLPLGCRSIYGDVFAFWFSELRITPELYDLVWDMFSSVPRPDVAQD